MEQLQQAEAAIAAGNKQEAYLLLARVLKQDQKNVEAWLLLSQAAATSEQERLFLDKAARIDPQNEAVQARLAALDTPDEALVELEPKETEPAMKVPEEALVELEPAETEPATIVPEEAALALPISEDPLDYEAQAEGETLPPWLAGEELLEFAEEADEEIIGTELVATETTTWAPDEEVPDWLQDEPEESWLAEPIEPTTPDEPEPAVEEEIQPEKVDETQPAPQPAKSKAKPSARRGSLLEWAIAGFAIVVFLLLIYFLFIR
jgi:hypothetical protein